MKNILKLRLNRHLLSLAMGVGMLGVLIVGNVGTAMASGTPTPVATGSSNSSFRVTPGSLMASSTFSFYSNAERTQSISSVALNGTDQTVYLNMPVTVTNEQGTDGGWTLDLYASRFSGTGHNLTYMPYISSLGSSSIITHQDTSSYLQAGDSTTGYSNGIQSISGETVPSNSDTQISLLEAGAGTYTNSNSDSQGFGMGSYTLTVPMTLKIAAQDYAANSYQSTFTFDLDPAV